MNWSRWNDDPTPSWNELAARAGCDPPLAAPGDRLEASVDVQAYWPAVRAVWDRDFAQRRGF